LDEVDLIELDFTELDLGEADAACGVAELDPAKSARAELSRTTFLTTRRKQLTSIFFYRAELA
jgi:hypothetical protein